MNALTKALQFLVSDFRDLKEEVSTLRSSSIVINKDVYNLAKSEIMTEVKGYTYDTSTDVQSKIEKLSDLVKDSLLLRKTEEEVVTVARPNKPQEELLLCDVCSSWIPEGKFHDHLENHDLSSISEEIVSYEEIPKQQDKIIRGIIRSKTDTRKKKKNVRFSENREINYGCPNCGKPFKNNDTMNEHIQSVHREVKMFPCQTCGQVFKYEADLQEHNRSCEQPYECRNCHKEMYGKNKLENHLHDCISKMMFNGESNHNRGNHTCTECNVSFKILTVDPILDEMSQRNCFRGPYGPGGKFTIFVDYELLYSKMVYISQ